MTNEAIRKRDMGLDKSLNKKFGLLIDKIAKCQRQIRPLFLELLNQDIELQDEAF